LCEDELVEVEDGKGRVIVACQFSEFDDHKTEIGDEKEAFFGDFCVVFAYLTPTAKDFFLSSVGQQLLDKLLKDERKKGGGVSSEETIVFLRKLHARKEGGATNCQMMVLSNSAEKTFFNILQWFGFFPISGGKERALNRFNAWRSRTYVVWCYFRFEARCF
jgi:hypothetical protein